MPEQVAKEGVLLRLKILRFLTDLSLSEYHLNPQYYAHEWIITKLITLSDREYKF